MAGGESLADLLRRFRRAAGLTQEELAERAGLSPEAVGALERGTRRAPYRDTVGRLADARGLDQAERAALQSAAKRRRGGADRSGPRPEPVVGRDGVANPPPL